MVLYFQYSDRSHPFFFFFFFNDTATTEIYTLSLHDALPISSDLCSARCSAQGRIVIQASTVIDGKGGVARNQQIVIEGSRIVSVGPGKLAATYDLGSLTLMPGWIDTHVHLNWHMDENRKSVSN